MTSDDRPDQIPQTRRTRALAWVVILLLIPAAFLVSYAYGQYRNRPRIILDSQQLSAMSQPSVSLSDRVEAPELYAGITNTTDAHPIEWNGRPVKVEDINEQVVVTDAITGTRVASTDLSAFYSLGRLRAVPVCHQPDSRDMLAVLVSLRATSHRSMLLIYGADGRLIYQHQLERLGGSGADTMYVGHTNTADALVVDNQGLVSGWTCR